MNVESEINEVIQYLDIGYKIYLDNIIMRNRFGIGDEKYEVYIVGDDGYFSSYNDLVKLLNIYGR